MTIPPKAQSGDGESAEWCSLCAAGFPMNSASEHYGTQGLGMIPNTRCRALPPDYSPHCLPLEIRFWTKVKADMSHANGCWLWTGSVLPSGYGKIWVNGGPQTASRIAWELRHAKPFPAGMFACHKCDNPLCVRPDHIFPGTNMDNHLDAKAKGRLRPRAPGSHCQRGHEMTGDNVAFYSGHRKCRTCERLAGRRRYARNKAAALAAAVGASLP